MNLVITISRRFGTGASLIAQELSEKLGVPVYDKALLRNWRNIPVLFWDVVHPRS